MYMNNVILFGLWISGVSEAIISAIRVDFVTGNGLWITIEFLPLSFTSRFWNGFPLIFNETVDKNLSAYALLICEHIYDGKKTDFWYCNKIRNKYT